MHIFALPLYIFGKVSSFGLHLPISFAIMKTVKYCNCSGRSKQQATGLRAASVGAKRVPPGLSTPRITCALAAFAAFV